MERTGESVPPPGGLECEVGVLYKTHAPGLFRYAALLARDGAQDALQEAFLRYFKARSEGRMIPNPQAWLFRVLRNLLIDAVRATGNHPEVALEAAGESCARGPDPESGYHRDELLARARAVLAPREMECIRLRAEGLNYEELADILEVRVGTVGALLAGAHRKIQRTLESTEGDRRAHFRSLPEGSPYAP